MSIVIYNTLSGRKKPFEPIAKGRVGMYVCGPTVYDVPHIGHARSAYVFDVIRRYFEYRKYKVTFVRNVTDLDDKIIHRAKEEFGKEELDTAVKRVSDKYLKLYHKCMDDLGIGKPDIEPRATEYIGKIKDFISVLIEKGAAYASGGDVYFDVRKAKGYGKLSKQTLEMLESGARILPGENKKDPLDFALWKSSKKEGLFWDSPWGPGRPGWHIECSVMASDILGDEFDIHGGGRDLVFPHHENEIAQSEGAGKGFARYWIHNGLLTIKKEKMAKSLGNFVTVEKILEDYSPDVLKLLFLSTHYSHPVDFSWERMDAEKEALNTLIIFLEKVKERENASCPIGPGAAKLKKTPLERFKEKLGEVYSEFERDMDNDFNTPNALAVLFNIVRAGNRLLYWSGYDDREHLKYLKKARESILELGGVFGLAFKQKEKPLSIPEKKIRYLIDRRNRARQEKDFETADSIRDELEKAGIIVEDHKGESTWRMK